MARSIASEIPGFDDKFRMQLRGDARLLNAARSAVQDAAPVAGTFIKHGMPADFLDRLDSNVRDFEHAAEEHARGKAICSAGACALQANLREAQAAGNRLDVIVRNTAQDDPALLDAWKRARRMQPAVRSRPEDDSEPLQSE
jgi:hypothetical protein